MRIGGWQDQVWVRQCLAVADLDPEAAVKGGRCSGLEAAWASSPEGEAKVPASWGYPKVNSSAP